MQIEQAEFPTNSSHRKFPRNTPHTRGKYCELLQPTLEAWESEYPTNPHPSQSSWEGTYNVVLGWGYWLGDSYEHTGRGKLHPAIVHILPQSWCPALAKQHLEIGKNEEDKDCRRDGPEGRAFPPSNYAGRAWKTCGEDEHNGIAITTRDENEVFSMGWWSIIITLTSLITWRR